MTARIVLSRPEGDGDKQVEVVQLNEGATTVLGTLDGGATMPLTLHSGQSFMVREKAAADDNENRNGGLEGGDAGAVSVPGDNMSSGRTIR